MSSRLSVLHGDCRDTLQQIPAGTVQCCVTSPPYWGLRSYLPNGHPDKDREIGQESTPEAFVATMVEVFREVRRCLHESGVLFLNLGDSYASGGVGGYSDKSTLSGFTNQNTKGRVMAQEPKMREVPAGLKPKDLCGIPWRVVLALQADGWFWRSVICWHKKSCMPESVTDRPTNSWEPIFLLAKSQRYFYDAVAVQEQSESEGRIPGGNKKCDESRGDSERDMTIPVAATRNQRNVWSLGPEPYSEAHFATFPTEIPRRAILAGTSARGCCPKCFAPWERVVEKETTQGVHGGLRKRADAPGAEVSATSVFRTGADTQSRTVGWQPSCKCGLDATIPATVLDPFGGSGTTGMVATELGRNAILCELNDGYLPLINKRTNVTRGLALA